MTENTQPKNRLLAALPDKIYQNLLSKTERIELIFNNDVYEHGDVISDVYFPESGIVSLLSAVEANSTLEVGIVGNEGMVGLPPIFGCQNFQQSRRRSGRRFRSENGGGRLSRRMQIGRITANFAAVHAFVNDANLAIGGVQPLPRNRAASRPLAADDRRPDARGRISDYAGISLEYARCPPRSRQQIRDPSPAAKINQLLAR